MFIDTHAHTYHERFVDDIDTIVQRAKEAKVSKVLLPNIDSESIVDLLDLCDRYPDHFYPMVGLHPCNVKEDYRSELAKLEPYLADDRIVAIGETGTDLYWDKTFVEQQQESLVAQISWAKEHNLPIVLHSRDSIDLSIEIIRKHQDGSLRGVFHCYGGTQSQSEQIIDLGFMMSIGGTVTFKNNQSFREVLPHIPIEHIMLETDAPYLAPHPNRGQRNESSFIPLIVDTLSGVYDLSAKEIADITYQNAERLFSL
jgi:TatD DNase family protein